MKKIFLSLVMVIVSITSFSQTIIKDNEKNNIRTVETTGITARSFTDRVVWNFGLEAHQDLNNKDSIQYILIVNLNAMTKIPITDNGMFLIKTFNNDIIELTNLYNNHNTVTLGYSYHRPIVGNIGTVSANNIHRNIAYFIINEIQLKSLETGVKKVRVETDNGYEEKEYKKDKCGKFLFNSYNIISDYLKTTKSKSIKDDF